MWFKIKYYAVSVVITPKNFESELGYTTNTFTLLCEYRNSLYYSLPLVIWERALTQITRNRVFFFLSSPLTQGGGEGVRKRALWFWLASVCHLIREECSCSKGSSRLSHNHHQICCTCIPTWPAFVCLSTSIQKRDTVGIWQTEWDSGIQRWRGDKEEGKAGKEKGRERQVWVKVKVKEKEKLECNKR